MENIDEHAKPIVDVSVSESREEIAEGECRLSIDIHTRRRCNGDRRVIVVYIFVRVTNEEIINTRTNRT